MPNINPWVEQLLATVDIGSNPAWLVKEPHNGEPSNALKVGASNSINLAKRVGGKAVVITLSNTLKI